MKPTIFSKELHKTKEYSEKCARGSEISANKVLSWVKKYIKGKTIDIGCGRGYFLKGIHKITGIKPCAVDINKSFIEKIEKELGFEAKCADVDNEIPYPDKSFDTVFCNQMLEHLISPTLFLRECLRILKNNGTLIVGVPNVYGLHKSSYYNPAHINYFDSKTLYYTLLSNGFLTERMIYTAPHGRLLPFINSLRYNQFNEFLKGILFLKKGDVIFAVAKNCPECLKYLKKSWYNHISKLDKIE